MRVMQEVLSPGMQHGEEPDLRTQMPGVGGDGAQRLRGGPEQDVVNHGLVLERNGLATGSGTVWNTTWK